MKASEYIESLESAADRAEAAHLHYLWWAWSNDEWTAEDELEYNRCNYLGVLAEVEMGSDDYTAEDLENYRQSAAA